MKQHYYVPIRIVSESNQREHWSKKHKRKEAHRDAINAVCRKEMQSNTILPADIRLTRVAPRNLDTDNLWASMKTPIDTIADILIPGLAPGRADGDPRLKFGVCQKKGEPKEYALEIDIETQEMFPAPSIGFLLCSLPYQGEGAPNLHVTLGPPETK